jgi:hypothetical protein
MASSVAGYTVGGYAGGYVSTVDRFLFSNDSRTTLSTGLSGDRYDLAAMASSVAGYATGGYQGSSPTGRTTVVDRFLFSNDSRTTLGTGLSAVNASNAACASSVAGYTGGGQNANIDRFLFSNDSRTTLSATLSTTREYLAAMASSAAGYWGGGSPSITTVQKLLFSDDSIGTLGTGLSVNTTAAGAMANLGA